MGKSTVLVVGALCAVGLAIACGDDDSTGPTERFVVQLTGANEVPPNASTATANATITIVDENTITLTVTAQNLTAVKQAHFHAGTPGTNGGVILGFISNQTPTGDVNGELHSSTITRSSPFTTGFTFDSLLTRIRNGTTYVNIHTTAFPGGEIRAQVQ